MVLTLVVKVCIIAGNRKERDLDKPINTSELTEFNKYTPVDMKLDSVLCWLVEEKICDKIDIHKEINALLKLNSYIKRLMNQKTTYSMFKNKELEIIEEIEDNLGKILKKIEAYNYSIEYKKLEKYLDG